MWLGWRNGAIANAGNTMRYFSSSSRKRAPNLRKINPKVPFQEAAYIAEGLYHVIKNHGPLTISNTWNHAKEAGISGLSSKTHMKIMLHWMRGRNMLKLFCQNVGSSKKFLLSTLPEEPQTNQLNSSMESVEPKPKTGKPSMKKRK
ncbi:uncharacterized protein LOC111392621 [Olea europaea var. sylvestris]|uniref:uncharacterized protein LOC111392621 n=1 Tax=Olea europaea var. sylvestris TaxID=158386 RepID=UPI000C1D3CBC|nr:uncharacterized protein LOC111392621 [Olea europaea var. sylvestris]